MSDLREQLANEVFHAIDGENDIEDSFDAADRIIDAIREALLSDAACNEGANVIEAKFPELGCVPRWDAKPVIEAALHAVVTERDDHE